MIRLENELQLFVPDYDNGGQKVDVTMYEKTLCAMVGGATTYRANGKWLDDSKLYNDDMNVITANYSGRLSLSNIEKLASLISRLFFFECQLAVSLKVNGTLYILNSDDYKTKTITSDLNTIF
jgi:hypothetical protein